LPDFSKERSENRIYFFTGTSNSLRAAKAIAEGIGDCELVAIKKGAAPEALAGLDRLGFVFPVYYMGLPALVADFIRGARFPEQGQTYVFALATLGGSPSAAIPMARDLLREKGRKNAGQRRLPLPNERAHRRKRRRVGKTSKLMLGIYEKSIAKARSLVGDFNVSAACVSCGTCRDLCPAKNIEMGARPAFGAECAACMSCIQLCPKRAINYKDKTQGRGRYRHPEVSVAEIARY